MKIVPILAITNALALALAIYLFVQQGDRAQPGARRSDSNEVARLATRLDALEREHERVLAMRGIERAPARETPLADAPAGGGADGAAPEAPRESAPLGANAPGEEPEAGADFDPKEMDVFRRKVRKANELNSEEDQKSRIVERIDELVKQNKIAPLNTTQKDGVASVVLAHRRSAAGVWRRVGETVNLENVSREERGRIVRQEYEALRAEAQRSLEAFMPAVDAKTYLDETMRDQMRGGFGGGFGGGGGGPGQTPAPPSPSR